ncbi:hypothetical protein EON82_08340 [bacterium]|nr:MAG: hypothetical protein EON82_08340 [bacterium]
MKKTTQVLALASLAAALTGCNMTGAMTPPDAFPTGTATAGRGATAASFTPNSVAGLPVTQDTDATKFPKLVATKNAAGAFGQPRSDPFALTLQERGFETVQTTERFFSSTGGFGVFVTPKPETEEAVVAPEPQPYRRLSGIVVGDSILAILEEEGKAPVIVTPGMRIPDSPWRVVSIDQDKAVLRRSGNVKPNQIVVRLEQPRFGTTPSGGAPGGFPGGAPGGFPGGGPPGGGFPGGPPGGFPGRGGRGPAGAG